MNDKTLPVKITQKALIEVKHIMANKNIPKDYGLRIGMKGGGCGGMSFILGFDKVKEADDEFSQDGVPVYIAKRDVMYLIGTTVDFEETSEARGFSFSRS